MLKKCESYCFYVLIYFFHSRWFEQLNKHYGVRGRSYYLYKPCGNNRTLGRSSDEALQLLKKGLQDETKTFIYHCWNHYFCPIGYEDVPLKAADAYRYGAGLNIDGDKAICPC